MLKAKHLLVLTFLLPVLTGADLFAQSPIDSLQIYNPFTEMLDIRRILSQYFSRLGVKNEQKLKLYSEKLLEAKVGKLPYKETDAFINIGDIYFRSGIYEQALNNYFSAQKVLKALKDTVALAFVDVKIAQVYYFADQSPAPLITQSMYKTLQNSGDNFFSAYGYYAQGLIEKNNTIREGLYRTAIKLQTEIVKNKPGDTTAREYLSIYLNGSGRVNEALAIAENIGNNWLTILYLNNIGYDKVLNGKYKEALPLFYKSLDLCKTERFKTLLRNTYDNIGRAYRLMGQTEKAVIYMELQHYVEESLFKEQFSMQAAEFKNKIEDEKRELQISLLQDRQTLLEENIKSERQKSIIVSVSLGFVVIAMSLLLVNRRKLKSVNRELDNQKLALSQLNTDLENRIELRTNELIVANQAHQAAEEKYRTVADFTYDWEYWTNPEGVFIYVSPACEQITGYTVQDFMNDKDLIKKIIHPDDMNYYNDHIANESENKDVREISFRIQTRSKEIRWIGHASQPVYSKEGEFLGIRGSNRDITERKIAEEEIQNSREQLRNLANHLESVREEEKAHIAREIHDELGHLLTALRYDLENLTEDSATANPSVQAKVTPLISIVDALVDTVRSIATELRPGILDHLGLIPALKWHLGEFVIRTKIACPAFSFDENIQFDKHKSTVIFRVFQEILTNIARHAEATAIEVMVKSDAVGFMLQVKDNGKGFKTNDSSVPYSMGILGMHERVHSIDGEIIFDSSIGMGTTVTVRLNN